MFSISLKLNLFIITTIELYTQNAQNPSESVVNIWFLLFLQFACILPATGSDVLRCLGAEEAAIFEAKETGPLYRLNQSFINLLPTGKLFSLRPQYFSQVCGKKSEFPPSVGFLQLILLEGTNSFDMTHSEKDPFFELTNSAIQELNQNIGRIFFTYISDVQEMSNYPYCLKEDIEEIPYFIDKFKYLESESSVKLLLSEKNKIRAIFQKLKNLDSILKECEKKEKKREEELGRKK